MPKVGIQANGSKSQMNMGASFARAYYRLNVSGLSLIFGICGLRDLALVLLYICFSPPLSFKFLQFLPVFKLVGPITLSYDLFSDRMIIL